MTDPVSSAVQVPNIASGAAAAAYRSAVDRGARRGMGRPAVRPRRVALDQRPGGRSRHRATGSAGSMPRSISRTTSRRSRASATPSSTPGSRPPSSPGWAAAASRRTCCIGRSARPRATSTCASSIRPIRSRRGRPRRPRSAADAGHHRQQVGHDGRAEHVPRRRLGARREQALERVPHHVTSKPGDAFVGHHRSRARASRRSATTTSSARSSSTRPTSAVGTAR